MPSSSRINISEWQLNIDGEKLPLPETLPHWDQGMPLRITLKAVTDIDGIKADCELANDDIVRLAVLWYSPGTGLRGQGSYRDLDISSSSLTVTLTFSVPGMLLANRVRIEVLLVLAQNSVSASLLAPKKAGSILWREEKTILLEGQGARFPVELIDFTASQWLPENAAWFLEWNNDDYHQMLLGNMRLLINSNNASVKRAVTETLLEDRTIRDFIWFDVARAIIMRVLENNDFSKDIESYEDGSIGVYIRRLIYTIFPGRALDGLIEERIQHPSLIECALQNYLQLFQEV